MADSNLDSNPDNSNRGSALRQLLTAILTTGDIGGLPSSAIGLVAPSVPKGLQALQEENPTSTALGQMGQLAIPGAAAERGLAARGAKAFDLASEAARMPTPVKLAVGGAVGGAGLAALSDEGDAQQADPKLDILRKAATDAQAAQGKLEADKDFMGKVRGARTGSEGLPPDKYRQQNPSWAQYEDAKAATAKAQGDLSGYTPPASEESKDRQAQREAGKEGQMAQGRSDRRNSAILNGLEIGGGLGAALGLGPLLRSYGRARSANNAVASEVAPLLKQATLSDGDLSRLTGSVNAHYAEGGVKAPFIKNEEGQTSLAAQSPQKNLFGQDKNSAPATPYNNKDYLATPWLDNAVKTAAGTEAGVNAWTGLDLDKITGYPVAGADAQERENARNNLIATGFGYSAYKMGKAGMRSMAGAPSAATAHTIEAAKDRSLMELSARTVKPFDGEALTNNLLTAENGAAVAKVNAATQGIASKSAVDQAQAEAQRIGHQTKGEAIQFDSDRARELGAKGIDAQRMSSLLANSIHEYPQAHQALQDAAMGPLKRTAHSNFVAEHSSTMGGTLQKREFMKIIRDKRVDAAAQDLQSGGADASAYADQLATHLKIDTDQAHGIVKEAVKRNGDAPRVANDFTGY